MHAAAGTVFAGLPRGVSEQQLVGLPHEVARNAPACHQLTAGGRGTMWRLRRQPRVPSLFPPCAPDPIHHVHAHAGGNRRGCGGICPPADEPRSGGSGGADERGRRDTHGPVTPGAGKALGRTPAPARRCPQAQLLAWLLNAFGPSMLQLLLSALAHACATVVRVCLCGYQLHTFCNIP